MQAVRLLIKGNFNSFRIEGGIKYHRTYQIPSKTTLIGLLGATMGLDDVNLAPLFGSVTTNAILTKFNGTASDLWLITKLKTGVKPESSPIVREMLFEPEYYIYYSTTNSSEIQLDDIINAFYDPEYALTLGRSDEMIEIIEIKPVTLLPVSDGYFKNTILPFNYKEFFDGYENVPLLQGRSFSLPNVVNIPISFKIDSDRRVRTPLNHLQITLVYDIGIKVKGREDGLADEQRRLFLY